MGGRAWGGKGWNFDVQIALSHATVTLCTTDLLLKPAQPLTINAGGLKQKHNTYSTWAIFLLLLVPGSGTCWNRRTRSKP